MEELKLLVEMVANLPSLALWVIAAFFAYKVVCIGSIYGVLRLLIDRTHSWLTKPKNQDVDVRLMLDGRCITGTQEGLVAQLERIRLRPQAHGSWVSSYIHDSDVKWLSEAISEKLEAAAKKPKGASIEAMQGEGA